MNWIIDHPTKLTSAYCELSALSAKDSKWYGLRIQISEEYIRKDAPEYVYTAIQDTIEKCGASFSASLYPFPSQSKPSMAEFSLTFKNGCTEEGCREISQILLEIIWAVPALTISDPPKQIGTGSISGTFKSAKIDWSAVEAMLEKPPSIILPKDDPRVVSLLANLDLAKQEQQQKEENAKSLARELITLTIDPVGSREW